MAKIWPAYEGSPHTIGAPWAEMPVDEAAALLDVEPNDFLGDPSDPPRFGGTGRLAAYAGYRHVVLELDEEESGAGWRAGYYRSPLSPRDAYLRLLGRELENELLDWRVGLERTVDSGGDPMIEAQLTLRENAPRERWEYVNRERVQERVREAIAEAGLDDWVYVTMREERDQRAAS